MSDYTPETASGTGTVAATATSKPQIQWFVDRAGSMAGIRIVGLPSCNEKAFAECALAQILHEYKRLLLSGVYGRTKKQHVQLTQEVEKRANKAYTEELEKYLAACPPERRKALTSALHQWQIPRRDITWLGDDLPKRPQYFLPEDSKFTLPMAYTVGIDRDEATGLAKITVYIFNNTALPALTRLSDGSLQALTFAESFEELAFYSQIIAYDLQAFFEEAEYHAAEHGGIPDYYGYCGVGDGQ